MGDADNGRNSARGGDRDQVLNEPKNALKKS